LKISSFSSFTPLSHIHSAQLLFSASAFYFQGRETSSEDVKGHVAGKTSRKWDMASDNPALAHLVRGNSSEWLGESIGCAKGQTIREGRREELFAGNQRDGEYSNYDNNWKL
jgi:hypothetical protein